MKLAESLSAVKKFEGMVMVLHHASTIQPKYQAMMHCGAIRVCPPSPLRGNSTDQCSKRYEYYPLTILPA